MQRASRFLCSTASQSSPSNITLRSRKRSGSFSAGCDNLETNRDPENDDDASRTKAGSVKYNVRLLPGSLRNVRKPKSSRASKPNFRCFQNAVVLAPFYTLKKCFQTKLVDLYSLEKMKKINHRTKMAKKKNMCFEYDIIELKPSERAIKKERKPTKKPNLKSRSVSYCQCKKTKSETEGKMSQKNFGRGGKTSGQKYRASQILHHSGQLEPKRRKPNSKVISPIILKSEFVSGQKFCPSNSQFFFPGANPNASVESSRSRCDSWETYSNSPSCKEEHMEGSLAISTTSFDSCLEHFDKNSWDFSDSCKKRRKRAESRKIAKRVDAGFPSKPSASSSKRLIVHVEKKNSDGQIVDFLDREPQIQVISSAELNQHLQPLRHQTKTKSKKLGNEPAAGYYLRSLSLSKEALQKENQRLITSELREDKSFTGNAHFKDKALQTDVATQVEGHGLERRSNTSQLNSSQESATNLFKSSATNQTYSFCVNVSSEETPERPLCDTNPPSPNQKTESSPKESASERIKLLCETPHSPRYDPLESQVNETQRTEIRLDILGEHSNRESIESVAGLRDRFQDQTNAQQSQDKDSDFIFGSRNTMTRMGESCKFSFGLNFIFSDDED